MSNPFELWLSEMLRVRGLGAPDTRRLYSYRLSDEEFSTLKELLSEKIRSYRRTQVVMGLDGARPLVDISRNIPGFDSLIVLYSAEWWRRHYSGHGFSWEPILESLGAWANDWDSGSRSEIIRQGLGFWNHRPESGHFSYITSIVRHAGLPMRLLSNAKGPLGQLFFQALRDFARRGGGAGQSELLLESVKQASGYLPGAYQTQEITRLLADVIVTVLSLREEAGLSDSDAPIETLNARIPDWKDRFPFPPSDENFSSLLEKLVTESAREGAGRRSSPGLELSRSLVATPEGSCLSAHLLLPPALPLESLVTCFSLPPEEVSQFRILTLSLLTEKGEGLTELRRLSQGHGPEGIRYVPLHPSLRSMDPSGAHTLRLSLSDGRSVDADLLGGEALDGELPWIFAPKEGEILFVRQGGGKVSSPVLYLSLPEGTALPSEESFGRRIPSGDGRLLVEVTSSMVVDVGGETLSLVPGSTLTEESGRFQMMGERLALSPRLRAFWGVPRIVSLTVEGIRRSIPPDRLGWRVPGEGWSPQPPIGGAGPCEVRVERGEEILFRSSFLLLPREARIEMLSLGRGRGEILLENFGARDVVIKPAEGLSVDVRREGERIKILVVHQDGVGSAGEISGHILWKVTRRRTMFSLPLPFQDVRGIEGNGHLLSGESFRDLKDLVGIRIVFVPGGGARCLSLRLDLREGGGGILRTQVIPLALPAPPRHLLERRLIEFSTDISALLAHSSSLNARVEVSGEIDGKTYPVCSVARYAVGAKALFAESLVQLFPAFDDPASSDLRALLEGQVRTLRLESPEEEAVELGAGPRPNTFDFDRSSKGAGTWLVYPGPASSLTFRPVAFNIVGGDEGEMTSLDTAIKAPREDLRRHEFREVFDRLSKNFQDEDWRRIVATSAKLGHLPLSALDLCRAAVDSPSMMASLLFRSDEVMWEGFLDRFSREFLFFWEMIPLHDWIDSYRESQRAMRAKYPEAVADMIFNHHMKKRFENLVLGHPALAFLPEFLPKLAALPSGAGIEEGRINTMFYNVLFDGADCPYQRLIRRDIDRWPQGPGEWMESVRNTPAGRLLWREREAYRSDVINFPVALVLGTLSRSLSARLPSKNLSKVQDLIMFDREWFEEAYHFAMSAILGWVTR